MKKIILTFLILVVSIDLFGSDANTKFQVYVPPNNKNSNYYSSIRVTAFSDSTFVILTDDNFDGDNDDSWSGLLNRGETYIRYIRNGSINDDAGGKWDGDYFIVSSNKPVLVSQSTNSDWQHDWIPSDNYTMKGSIFYIYTPKTSYSPRDLNIFPYEDSTFVDIKDVTVIPKTTTGKCSVDVINSTTVAYGFMDVKQDLIYYYVNGRNLFQPGRTYMVETSKPVTVQFGALYKNERDAGSYVPGNNGSSVGNYFIFAVPTQSAGKQELRMVSFNNGVSAKLDYLNNSNSWTTIDTYNLNSLQHADWKASSGQRFGLFRVSVTGGKIGLFEANYMETGSYNKSDAYSYAASESENGAGKKFLIYVLPPCKENKCLDPFTNTTFGQQGPSGQFTHVFISAYYNNTSVSIKDIDTDGNIIDTVISIQPNAYIDFKLDKNEYQLLTQSGRRPYLTVVSTQPVSAAISNWSDDWMSYSAGVLVPNIKITSSPSTNSCTTGDNVTFNSVIKNVSSVPVTGTETNVLLQDGLNYYSSNMVSSSQGNLGSGQLTTYSNGEKALKWQNYIFNPGDSLNVSIVTGINSVYHNNTNIPTHSNFIVTTSSKGIASGDSINVQSTTATYVRTTQVQTLITKYTTAYEDLKNSSWNDWDVNDFVAGITQTRVSNSQMKITKLTYDYEALARGSSFDSQFKHKILLNGTSTVSFTVWDTLNNVIPGLSFGPETRNGGFTIIVFPSTIQAMPGSGFANTDPYQIGVIKGFKAKLTVIVDPNQNPISSFLNSHSDPYIRTETGLDIHIASIAGSMGNTQNVDNNVISYTPLYGYYLDLAYKLPNNFKWDLEGPNFAIWRAYPNFVNYIISGKTTNLDWFDFPDTTKVWNKRVVIRTDFLADNLRELSVANTIRNNARIKMTDTAGSFFASPKLADINGDGNKEIVVGSIDKNLYVYKSNGEILNGFPVKTQGIIRSTAAIDLRKDGSSVIVFGSGDGNVYAVDQKGDSLAGFPVSTGFPIKTSPVISDINSDGQKEIIVFSGDGSVYVYNYQAELFNGFPKRIQTTQDTYGSLIIMSSPAVADMDGDSAKEMVFCTIDSSITVLDVLGNVRQGFPKKLNGIVYSSPVISKIDSDEYKIVITAGNTLYIIDKRGNINMEKEFSSEFISSPVVVDIDNDGKAEIIAATIDGKILALSASGTISEEWEFETVSEILSSPIIADVNGDDKLEILIGLMNGSIFVLTDDGQMDINSLEYFTSFSSWIISSLAIDDIDDNGKLDVVAASFDKTLKVFELPLTDSSSAIKWRSFGNDLGNSRLTDFTDTISPQKDELGIIFNYPNPVTEGVTTFRLELPANVESIELRIFDIGGELVKKVSKTGFIRNGFYWDYTWNLRNENKRTVSSGAYIYMVKAIVNGKEFQKTQKLGIIR